MWYQSRGYNTVAYSRENPKNNKTIFHFLHKKERGVGKMTKLSIGLPTGPSLIPFSRPNLGMWI